MKYANPASYSQHHLAPLLNAIVEGQEVSLFMDTGANINIVDLPTLIYYDVDLSKMQEPTIIIRDVNGGLATPYGEISVDIELDNEIKSVHFAVVYDRKTPGDFLIAYPTIFQWDAYIHPRSRSVLINGKRLKLSLLNKS